MRDCTFYQPQINHSFIRAFSRFALLLFFSFLIARESAWADQSSKQQYSRDHQKDSLTEPYRIAIIIDDLGYNLKLSKQAANLPGAVTLSILPFSPHGKTIAKLGLEKQKEIMLHTPMSSVLEKPLDEGGLTASMSQKEFNHTLQKSLQEIPGVQGLNNHMGSELTQQAQPMAWLMQALLKENLYFVDSRTISSSVAWETAKKYKVPTTQRDIFLDNDNHYPAIAEQFKLLLSVAKKRGQAVAIAHPYAETIRFLESAIPMLKQANFILVPVSDLLAEKPNQKHNDRHSEGRIVDWPYEVNDLINQSPRSF